MWHSEHLSEEVAWRMNTRLKEAEQWRLAREVQGQGRPPGQFLGNLLESVATTLRQRLAIPPRPQEKYC